MADGNSSQVDIEQIDGLALTPRSHCLKRQGPKKAVLTDRESETRSELSLRLSLTRPEGFDHFLCSYRFYCDRCRLLNRPNAFLNAKNRPSPGLRLMFFCLNLDRYRGLLP